MRDCVHCNMADSKDEGALYYICEIYTEIFLNGKSFRNNHNRLINN